MKTMEKPEAETKARTAFQPMNVLNQVVIAGAAVAPDASSIVYIKRTVVDGQYQRNLWRTDFDGAGPEQLTRAHANDTRPRFSPDARQILFISDRSGKPQVWVMPTTGGEPRQITDLADGVGAADWSPDSKQLLIVAPSGEQRFIVGKADDPTARRIRDYTWRLDGAGVRDEFASLWITDVDDPKPRRITKPDFNVDAAAWSPDGSQIAFLADLTATAGLEEIAAVHVIPAEGGEPNQVARLDGGIRNLAWNPGPFIAFLGTGQAGSPGWADLELHVVENGTPRRLAAEKNLTLELTSYGDYQDGEQLGSPPVMWEDDSHVVGLVSHHGYSHPYRFGLDGKVEALATRDKTCSSLATGGGRMVVIAAGADHHNEVFAVEDGDLRQLTDDGSTWYQPFARQPEHHEISHPDGHTIDTRLILAHGKRELAPLVIDVHGGPNSSFGPTPWLEMNALADAGIHVIYSNPRGSTSYGEKYARDLEGVWGDPDGSDLLRIIDWAVDEVKIADRQKIGIMGLSYGGFMTNYMLAKHPGVFAAAVSENPVTDLLGEWATSDFGRYIGRRAVEVQSPYENIEAYLSRSPWVKMHQNFAPLLLLHAEKDMRCPPGNSEIVFHILRELGREVEMIRYPEESHIMLAIGRPDRRVDRIERMVNWFKKHLGPATKD